MSDKLRSQIAAVIAREIHADDPNEPCQWCVHFADKFIEDLHLTEDGGVIVGCAHD